ncbi:MAG: phenylacetic acid degradation protein [Anaerolineae bacterium]
MTDTQWPRYEVFKQDRPDQPHRSIGTVHAPDAEMALLNARDVFVRRPICHSMWVVREDAIFSKTAEELELDDSWQRDAVPAGAPSETYYVFQKQSQRRSMSFVFHVGEVEAQSPVQAMKKAMAAFTEGDPIVWWVCPESAIVRSQEDDIESMFAPVHNKVYRMPNQYRTVSAMQKIKRGDKR